MISDNNIQKKLFNQKGQALFEMILFLPMLLFLYSIYYTVGNSINGSINQQKAVRGYFYGTLKGNSYVISASDLKVFTNDGMKKIGFSALGWNEKLDSDKKSIAPCFKFSSLLKNGSDEECDSDQRPEEGSSRFIRLFTYYGVCGPSYFVTNDKVPGGVTYYDIPPNAQTQIGSCNIKQN